MPEEKQGNIFARLVKIAADCGALGKDSRNQQQGFNFRGIDAVMNHLHPIFAKHGVFILPEVLEEKSEERQTKSGGNLIYRILKIKFHFVAEDSSEATCTVIGEGMDSGDKGSNKAMAVALKYALTQMLLMPYDEVDADSESHPASIPVTPKPVLAPVAKPAAAPAAPTIPVDEPPAPEDSSADPVLLAVNDRMSKTKKQYWNFKIKGRAKDAYSFDENVMKTAKELIGQPIKGEFDGDKLLSVVPGLPF